MGMESGVGKWPRLTERVAYVVDAMAEAFDDDAAVTGLLLPGEEATLLEWGMGPSTAVPVARKWPATAPKHTPNGLPAALSAIVAICERSPISATVVSVSASTTSGGEPSSET